MDHGRSLLLFAIISVVVLICGPDFGFGQKHRGDEAKYTNQEASALIKLRTAVEKDLTDDYMKRDEYLISWLRARKLDVGKAANMLRQNLKWRREENIDSLADEEFPQFSGFLYDNRGHDKDGRPFAVFLYGTSWDARKAAISGQMKLLVRYLIRNQFEVPQKIARREGQADGINSTQTTNLCDLGGYNLRQHACVQCFEVYTGFVINYEKYYPQLINKMFAVNTPKIFDPAFALARPLFSEHFSNHLKMLGPNKEEWLPELLKHIPSDQLPTRVGGTSKLAPLSG